jgi:polyribonucleotide nucleotidyltransferase
MCVEVEDEIFKEELIEELEQIKQKNPDKDNKLSIIPKDEIKDTLGHSPDIADMMMMRMFFEFKRPKEVDNIRRSVQKQQARKRITKNEAR